MTVKCIKTYKDALGNVRYQKGETYKVRRIGDSIQVLEKSKHVGYFITRSGYVRGYGRKGKIFEIVEE